MRNGRNGWFVAFLLLALITAHLVWQRAHDLEAPDKAKTTAQSNEKNTKSDGGTPAKNTYNALDSDAAVQVKDNGSRRSSLVPVGSGSSTTNENGNSATLAVVPTVGMTSTALEGANQQGTQERRGGEQSKAITIVPPGNGPVTVNVHLTLTHPTPGAGQQQRQRMGEREQQQQQQQQQLTQAFLQALFMPFRADSGTNQPDCYCDRTINSVYLPPVIPRPSMPTLLVPRDLSRPMPGLLPPRVPSPSMPDPRVPADLSAPMPAPALPSPQMPQ
jgi:hypothetical protein